MTATYQAAIDELLGLFNDGWTAGAPTIVPYVPDVVWPGLEPVDNPDPSRYWVRVTQQTVNEEQSNLKGVGARRYTINGILVFQLFAPMSDSEGVETVRSLAVLARDIYRGKQTTLSTWLRNARILEVGPDNKWYQINVLVDYEHDDIS